MQRKTIHFLIFLTSIPFIYTANQIFNATDEWQRVPENVSIPAGLHVKLDLADGGRYAKLLDASDSSSETNEIVVTKKEDAIRRDYDFTKDKLENELAGLLKSEDADIRNGRTRNEIVNSSEESKDQKSGESEIEKKIRLEKLKNFMNEFNERVTTDFEKMNALVETLEKININETGLGPDGDLADLEDLPGNTDKKARANIYIEICEDLDWIISKVDNAKDAASHGILSRLINLYRNQPSKHIWRIFSASAQNNPPVAKALFKVLRPVIEENIRELEYNSGLLKSAIFTLSAITRSLPVEDQLTIDWNSLLESNNGRNEYLCNLLIDLKDVPYNCDRNERDEL